MANIKKTITADEIKELAVEAGVSEEVVNKPTAPLRVEEVPGGCTVIYMP